MNLQRVFSLQVGNWWVLIGWCKNFGHCLKFLHYPVQCGGLNIIVRCLKKLLMRISSAPYVLVILFLSLQISQKLCLQLYEYRSVILVMCRRICTRFRSFLWGFVGVVIIVVLDWGSLGCCSGVCFTTQRCDCDRSTGEHHEAVWSTSTVQPRQTLPVTRWHHWFVMSCVNITGPFYDMTTAYVTLLMRTRAARSS